MQHWIHCNKKIDVYWNINSVNSLYLTIGKADGYIEENNGNKYLVFASTDDNKNSNDILPLNKMLKLHILAVIVRFVFEEDRKYYPQVFFLDECLYEV